MQAHGFVVTEKKSVLDLFTCTELNITVWFLITPNLEIFSHKEIFSMYNIMNIDP